MLVCAFCLLLFARETAGAARTRSPLRPIFWANEFAKLGRMLSRECGVASSHWTSTVMPADAGIQYSEASVIESRTRGVLDTRVRGYDGGGWSIVIDRYCEEPLRRSNPALSWQPTLAQTKRRHRCLRFFIRYSPLALYPSRPAACASRV
jgi:hypothetical protein